MTRAGSIRGLDITLPALADRVSFLFGASRPGAMVGAMVGADGPLRREWWHRTRRGRVVGVLQAIDVEGAHA